MKNTKICLNCKQIYKRDTQNDRQWQIKKYCSIVCSHDYNTEIARRRKIISKKLIDRSILIIQKLKEENELLKRGVSV
jgi:hypothetical protein